MFQQPDVDFPSVEEFKESSLGFPPATASGDDNLHSRHFAALADSTVEALILIFMVVLRNTLHLVLMSPSMNWFSRLQRCTMMKGKYNFSKHWTWLIEVASKYSQKFRPDGYAVMHSLFLATLSPQLVRHLLASALPFGTLGEPLGCELKPKCQSPKFYWSTLHQRDPN